MINMILSFLNFSFTTLVGKIIMCSEKTKIYPVQIAGWNNYVQINSFFFSFFYEKYVLKYNFLRFGKFLVIIRRYNNTNFASLTISLDRLYNFADTLTRVLVFIS